MDRERFYSEGRKSAINKEIGERPANFAQRGAMGCYAIVTKEETGWLYGTGSLVLRMPTGLHAPFLALVIGAPKAGEYLGGSSVGATMQNLNQGILARDPSGNPLFANANIENKRLAVHEIVKKGLSGWVARMPVGVPPLAEQRRIVLKVEQLMTLVDALETQLATSHATTINLLEALVAELTARK
jgi:type I restriction enzyme S subunit